MATCPCETYSPMPFHPNFTPSKISPETVSLASGMCVWATHATGPATDTERERSAGEHNTIFSLPPLLFRRFQWVVFVATCCSANKNLVWTSPAPIHRPLITLPSQNRQSPVTVRHRWMTASRDHIHSLYCFVSNVFCCFFFFQWERGDTHRARVLLFLYWVFLFRMPAHFILCQPADRWNFAVADIIRIPSANRTCVRLSKTIKFIHSVHFQTKLRSKWKIARHVPLKRTPFGKRWKM